jgi:hypothetical protein
MTEHATQLDPVEAPPQPLAEGTGTSQNADRQGVDSREMWGDAWQDGNLFRLRTYLIGDREIDVDDRDAEILLILEMRDIPNWEYKARNVKVTVRIDDDPASDKQRNIAIGTGAETLIRNPGDDLDVLDVELMAPGDRRDVVLYVRTGAFSQEHLTSDRGQPAQAGDVWYAATIEYELVRWAEDEADELFTDDVDLEFWIAYD